ncbi:MAG: RNA-directed DNA polymerase [Candidatus Nanohalobium sp.]
MWICRLRISEDSKLLGLVSSLLNSYSSELGEGKGLPIGTLYSQLFANIYLNGFDHFVKQKLRADYYVRYMDDFVIFSGSKKRLHGLEESMRGFLNDNLELKLPETKTCIEPVKKGLTFLGYRLFPSHREVRSRNKKKFRRKLSNFKQRPVDFRDVLESIESWKGHSSHADAGNLGRELLGFID